jgi:transposase
MPKDVNKQMDLYRERLLAIYEQTQGDRTRAINRLHGLFLDEGITTVVKADLATDEKRRETIRYLGDFSQRRAKHHLRCIYEYEKELEEIEKEMAAESEGDEVIKRLQSVPGVGPKVSFAFASHVAPERFENASQVSNYLGLVPKVYMSGDTNRYGRITKRGNGYVRALLVQVGWALIRSRDGGKLKERFEYMTKEKSVSKKKAIVGIARRIGEMLYAMMRDKTEYDQRRPFIRPKQQVRESPSSLAESAMLAS